MVSIAFSAVQLDLYLPVMPVLHHVLHNVASRYMMNQLGVSLILLGWDLYSQLADQLAVGSVIEFSADVVLDEH